MQTLHPTVLAAVQHLADALAARVVDDPSTWTGLRQGHDRTQPVASPPRNLPDRPSDGTTDIDLTGVRWRPYPDAPVAAWLHLRPIDGQVTIVGHVVDERGRTATVPVSLPPGLAEWASHIPEPRI